MERSVPYCCIFSRLLLVDNSAGRIEGDLVGSIVFPVVGYFVIVVPMMMITPLTSSHSSTRKVTVTVSQSGGRRSLSVVSHCRSFSLKTVRC